MPQDILITPYKDSTSSGAKIDFTGFNSGASTITMRVLPDSTLSYEGTAGQLFSISNGLSSGTIFSVNDISGVPSIDVASSGLVRLAPFVGEVQTNKLYVQANPQSGTQTVQEWRNLSGTAMASVNTSGQFAGYLASGTGVGGSSGQMQFNAGGTIGGSAAVTFSSGTSHLNVNAQATNIVPIRVSVNSGHTANSFEVYNSGTLQSYIRANGGFFFQTNGTYEHSKSVVSMDASSTDTVLIRGVSNTNSAGTNSVVIRGYGAGSAGNVERADSRALLVGLRSGDAFSVQGTGRVAIGASYATNSPAGTTDYRGILIVENSIGIKQTFPSGSLHVSTGSAGIIGVIVQGFTSQTANLQEWQDSAGNSLMAVVPGATLVFAANTPNISGTVSNLVTSGSYYVRLNCTWSGSALTGIAPPTGLSQVDGKIMRLINAGTQPMKLTNMATSTATNRFACYNSGDLWMSPNDYYECTYDSTTFNGTSSGGAWRVHA